MTEANRHCLIHTDVRKVQCVDQETTEVADVCSSFELLDLFLISFAQKKEKESRKQKKRKKR